METKENRGLINKKASEDQFTTFCQLNLELSLSILSLPYSGCLEYSYTILSLEERRQRKDMKVRGRKDQARKSGIQGGFKQLQHDNLQVSSCMHDFLASFWHAWYMHVCFLFSYCLWHGFCRV